ncbi:hypothetical protein [Bradyrhizobium ganzhouense]
MPVQSLDGHHHDIYGLAITNIYALCQFGLRSFDGAVGWLGD